MRMWKFYYHPHLNERSTNHDHNFYGFTNDEKIAKRFIKERDPDYFTYVVTDADKSLYNEFKEKMRYSELKYHELKTRNPYEETSLIDIRIVDIDFSMIRMVLYGIYKNTLGNEEFHEIDVYTLLLDRIQRLHTHLFKEEYRNSLYDIRCNNTTNRYFNACIDNMELDEFNIYRAFRALGYKKEYQLEY